MIKLTDARWNKTFLCLHWNNINFLILFTRSKTGGEIELQQGTPQEQKQQPKCRIHMYSTFGDLKVPKHEIFDGVFFLHQKSPYGPVIHDLKWF
jgi:hypothetical protein